MADEREVGNRGGLVRWARGLTRARCRTVADRWEFGWWWQGMSFSECGSRGDGLFGFGLMGLEPTTDGRETVSRARLVCRVREKSRAGCCAVVDRREFGK